MATQRYTDNFGAQTGVAYQLSMRLPATTPDGTVVQMPQGYEFNGTVTGVTGDNAAGTLTIATAYTGAQIPLEATSSVAHETTDSAGVAIPANTAVQSGL